MNRRTYKGKNNPNFGNTREKCHFYIDGRTLKEYYCIDCGKQISDYRHKRCNPCARKIQKLPPKTEKFKKEMSKRMKGSKNPMFGKIAKHGKGNYYNNIYMRSTWEIAFAFFLDCSKIKWIYESKRFYFNDYSYLPDFYLPEFDCYIEIKGYWRDNAKERFKLLKKYYPKINIKLLMKKELSELGINVKGG